MNVKQAKVAIGSDLGTPSKMPGYSYSFSATLCRVGSKLRKIPGSVCASCYALRGNYATRSVKLSHERRLAAYLTDRESWIAGMIFLISRRAAPDDPYFRGHDSGDLLDLQHLLAWVDVARGVPWVRFWIPSREYQTVTAAQALLGSAWPVNLVVRTSAHMIGAPPPKTHPLTSTVDGGTGHPCPAPTQGNNCGSCRACWDPAVANIDYHQH